MKSVRYWQSHVGGLDYGATIAVAGWASNPCEPQLLEALANHPGCKTLYFIPLDGAAGDMNWSAMEHELDAQELDALRDNAPLWWKRFLEFIETRDDPAELLAFDIAPALARRGGPPLSYAMIEKRLQAHFSGEVTPLMTDRIDLYLSAHGQPMLDTFMLRRGGWCAHTNNPATAMHVDAKDFLPAIADLVQRESGHNPCAPCQSVDTVADTRAFMDTHGYDQIVIKEPHNSCGHGIYRVYRDDPAGVLMVEHPDRDHQPRDGALRHFPLSEDLFDQHTLLAMEWLDNSRGDIRAVLLNGKCVGAYKRMHGSDSWLCNYAQGATIHPVDMRRDLSRHDRALIHSVAQAIEHLGISHASIDLLCNKKGERRLSEINVGNTDDLVELSRHWDIRNAAHGRLSYPDQVAAEIMRDYRDVVERREELKNATVSAER